MIYSLTKTSPRIQRDRTARFSRDIECRACNCGFEEKRINIPSLIFFLYEKREGKNEEKTDKRYSF